MRSPGLQTFFGVFAVTVFAGARAASLDGVPLWARGCNRATYYIIYYILYGGGGTEVILLHCMILTFDGALLYTSMLSLPYWQIQKKNRARLGFCFRPTARGEGGVATWSGSKTRRHLSRPLEFDSDAEMEHFRSQK